MGLELLMSEPVNAVPLPGEQWHVGFSINASMDRALRILRDSYGDEKVYYPLVRELRPRPKRYLAPSQRSSPIGSLVAVLLPLWPRYFFLKFSLLDGKWRNVLERAEIQGLVCSDQHSKRLPAPMDDNVIDELRAKEENGAIPNMATIKELVYERGEKVRISSGPFSGHNGIVDKLPDTPLEQLDETARLGLLVDLFGRKSLVTLAITDIEKL